MSFVFCFFLMGGEVNATLTTCEKLTECVELVSGQSGCGWKTWQIQLAYWCVKVNISNTPEWNHSFGNRQIQRLQSCQWETDFITSCCDSAAQRPTERRVIEASSCEVLMQRKKPAGLDWSSALTLRRTGCTLVVEHTQPMTAVTSDFYRVTYNREYVYRVCRKWHKAGSRFVSTWSILGTISA